MSDDDNMVPTPLGYFPAPEPEKPHWLFAHLFNEDGTLEDGKLHE